MKFLALAGLGGVAAVAALFAAGPEIRRYPIPESEALERLSASTLPEPLFDMAGRQVSLIREDGALVWYVGDPEQRSIGRVTINGDGARTSVAVKFELADNALGRSPVADTRLTRSMAESIFAEHVDSTLDGRPFDARRMMAVTSRAIQADPEIVRDYGEAVDAQFNDVEAMLAAGTDGENRPREFLIERRAQIRENDNASTDQSLRNGE